MSTASGWAARQTKAETAREQWVTLENCRVRLLTLGPEDVAGTSADARQPYEPAQPPVLLLHGLLGYAFSWRHLMPVLAKSARVFAVDLPGVGFSDRPAILDRSFHGLGTLLWRAMDSLGIECIDLLGTSHGGAVAMAVAAIAPGRVRRLVLAAPAHPWSRHGLGLIGILRTRMGQTAFRFAAPHLTWLNDHVLRRMFADPARATPDLLEFYAAPTRIPGTYEHLLGILQTWKQDMQELERSLPRIAHLPALLVWGDRDPAVPVRTALLLKNRFANAELVILRDAGHLPYEEVPEEFNRVVCGFLSKEAIGN